MWWSTKPAKEADRTLERLHDRVETVERQVRSLLLEWESTYNKIRAVIARLNKRDERAETEVTPPASAGGDGSEPAKDDIDRIIAIRRGRRG